MQTAVQWPETARTCRHGVTRSKQIYTAPRVAVAASGNFIKRHGSLAAMADAFVGISTVVNSILY